MSTDENYTCRKDGLQGLNTNSLGEGCGNTLTVQCPDNMIAPTSPRFLTCGSTGWYNVDQPYTLHPAVICQSESSIESNIAVIVNEMLRFYSCILINPCFNNG